MYRSRTSLPEDLLLLCAVDANPRIQTPPYFAHALAGASVADLLLCGRAVLEGDRVRLLTTAPCGHPPTDDTVLALAERVGTRYGTPLTICLDRLKPRVVQLNLNSLVHRGLVYPQEEKRFLFRWTGYCAYDRALLGPRAAEMFRAVADPLAPARTRVLAALAHAARLTRRHYFYQPSKQRDYAVARLTQLVAADPVALAVDGLVRTEIARKEARLRAAAD